MAAWVTDAEVTLGASEQWERDRRQVARGAREAPSNLHTGWGGRGVQVCCLDLTRPWWVGMGSHGKRRDAANADGYA